MIHPIDITIAECAIDNIRRASDPALTTYYAVAENDFSDLRNAVNEFEMLSQNDCARHADVRFRLSLATTHFVSRAFAFYIALELRKGSSEAAQKACDELLVLLEQGTKLTGVAR